MVKNVEKEVKISIFERYARSCSADPVKDADVLIPDLAADIDDMLQTGIVKDTAESLDNNGIDDPALIIGRVKDIFDALDASRVVKKYGKKPAKAADAVKDAVSTSDISPS